MTPVEQAIQEGLALTIQRIAYTDAGVRACWETARWMDLPTDKEAAMVIAVLWHRSLAFEERLIEVMRKRGGM